jgi:hypothetical protein
MTDMISLGLRLTMHGGREALVRLVLLVAAVGVGVGLLLVTIAGVNAVNNQDDHYAWISSGLAALTEGGPHGSAEPLWFRIQGSMFEGQAIGVVEVAGTGPASPVPPGIRHLPAPGDYYASPALTALLDSTPAAELGDRFPGHLIGTIGDAALPAPNTLALVVGYTAAQMARMPGAAQVTRIAATPPSACAKGSCVPGQGINADGIDLILCAVALAILFPVLIFIGTATRLSAARREQRFAAMRLTGATPWQISVIAAVESTAAAVLGMAVGFGVFFGLRDPLASIPFTGAPFFPSEMSLSLLDVLVVAIGVPVAAAVVARLALRRVSISPLGVTRKVTPKPPRAWRIVPLLAGLAELGWFAYLGTPHSGPRNDTAAQIQALLPGFLLIVTGLVVAGPWLTMLGARLMARRTRRADGLIAARRLADDPRTGFRAVSGLVLALFACTVAVLTITTQDAKDRSVVPVTGVLASNTMVDQLASGRSQAPVPPISAPVIARLQAIHGVSGVAVVGSVPPGVSVPVAAWKKLGMLGPPGAPPPAGVVSCAALARVPAYGRCPAGAQVVAVVPWEFGGFNGSLPDVTWPAVNISPQRLGALDSYMLLVAADGSQAIEQARTVLWNAYPDYPTPETFAEQAPGQPRLDREYQQLADVIVLVSLVIAGCTLATAVAGGLAERKRPFSLLRLTGAPLGLLQRVVALESAVPLIVTAAVSIGAGFAASAMFAKAQLERPMAGPDPAYYLITALGIVLSLGIIAATMPLLKRITGPETARNE